MALKMDRDVRRVTVVKSGTRSTENTGTHFVYRRQGDDTELPIKRITLIKRDGRGRIISHETYGEERHGKRQSRNLRPVERSVREFMKFQSRLVNNYLSRHDRSNEKYRDGWLSDMPRNIFRAVKQSKPKRLLKLYSDRD